ncbi:hypothetical protein J7M00_07915 [bacterium]|nr:hypothetical protein [bacterium]
MTLSTVIVFVETLFVFQASPVAVSSDLMDGIYVATQNEIFHFSEDTVVETVSRAGNEMLSGITDIEFSGNWLYVLIGERKILRKFDRRLNYIGDIELMVRSSNLALSPDGDIWLFDEFSKKLAHYSSVGDPVEIMRISGRNAVLSDAVLIGFAEWHKVIDCLPIYDTAPKSIPYMDVPILWEKSEKVVIPSFEYNAKLKLFPTTRNVWISDGNIAYTQGDSIHICNYGTIEWKFFKKFPEHIVIFNSGLYAVSGKNLLKVGVKWQK